MTTFHFMQSTHKLLLDTVSNTSDVISYAKATFNKRGQIHLKTISPKVGNNNSISSAIL